MSITKKFFQATKRSSAEVQDFNSINISIFEIKPSAWNIKIYSVLHCLIAILAAFVYP